VTTEAPGIPRNVDIGTRVFAIGLAVQAVRTVAVEFYISRNYQWYDPTALPAWTWGAFLWGCLLWLLLLWRIRLQSAFCRAVLVFLAVWNLLRSAGNVYRSAGAFQATLPSFARFFALSYLAVEILYGIALCILYTPSATAWFKLRLRGGLPKPKEPAGPPPLASGD